LLTILPPQKLPNKAWEKLDQISRVPGDYSFLSFNGLVSNYSPDPLTITGTTKRKLSEEWGEKRLGVNGEPFKNIELT
jgi:hypothetical protein